MTTTQPLVFDDTTNKQGICQDIDFLCGSNLTSFPKLDKVRLVNLGLDSVCDLIQTVDGNWAFEDLGQTNLPIGYFDTVSGQQDYSIDNNFLSIRGVYINKGAGTGTDVWKQLDLKDRKDIMERTSTGTPTGFFLDGNSIYLDPIPAVTTTGNNSTLQGYGAKVLFERAIIYIATDATTQTLGYSPLFYRLASLYASRDWAMVNQPDRLNQILLAIQNMEQRLKQNYGRKNKTQNNRMKPMYQNNR